MVTWAHIARGSVNVALKNTWGQVQISMWDPGTVFFHFYNPKNLQLHRDQECARVIAQPLYRTGLVRIRELDNQRVVCMVVLQELTYHLCTTSAVTNTWWYTCCTHNICPWRPLRWLHNHQGNCETHFKDVATPLYNLPWASSTQIPAAPLQLTPVPVHVTMTLKALVLFVLFTLLSWSSFIYFLKLFY